MSTRFNLSFGIVAACLSVGSGGCERPMTMHQQEVARTSVTHDAAQAPTDLDSMPSDATRSSLVACPSIPAPKVERTTELRRECSLEGAYDTSNYCIVAAALRREGFNWDRVILVGEGDSRTPMRVSRYHAPKGTLILNPRMHGELVIDAPHHEVHFYCSEVLQDRVRLVLHRIITS
jgi:hypothetical protein